MGVKSLFSHTPGRAKPGKTDIDFPDASCLIMSAGEDLRRYSFQDTTHSPCTCPETEFNFSAVALKEGDFHSFTNTDS